MRQQLNRQKSSSQNKSSLDSGRRPGHYNPYTCQYVPAPKPNSLVEETWDSRSIGDTRQSRSAQKKEPKEDDVKLVDDEWLIAVDEEYLDNEDDNWDMESVGNEIEDDIILTDSDWSNFDSPGDDTTTTRQQSQGLGASQSTESTLAQRSTAQSIASLSSQLKYTPSKSTVMTKALSVTPLQSLRQESLVTQSQSSRVTNASTPQGPAFQQLQNHERAVSATMLVVDSPQPGSVVRKRSGQSIYKAPGFKPSDNR